MTPSVPPAPAAPPSFLPWWLAWLVFVVYGSLVPLDFHPAPLDQAWSRLVHAPLYVIGIAGRADWVANGVLYLPVGFLSASLLLGAGTARPLRRLASVLLGVAFGCLLAVTVELAQAFFPPRTVSLNDLLAEAIGTVIGAVAALAYRGGLLALLAGLARGGRPLWLALAPAYLVAYLLLALFPFDLLLSAAEWQQKWQGGQVALLVAGSEQGRGWGMLAVKLAVEVMAVLPLGAWWAWRRAQRGLASPPARALAGGALLGLVIEAAQLCIASGVSQGASVLTRALGVALGAWLVPHFARSSMEDLRAGVRRWTLPLLLTWLPLLSLLHGWWRAPWAGVDQAWARAWHEVNYLPFYYHYFTTEMHAVVSLIAIALAYAPLAVVAWAWHTGAVVAALAAGLLALLGEVGRLMVPGSHPDPTNALIAAAVVWGLRSLLGRWSGARR